MIKKDSQEQREGESKSVAYGSQCDPVRVDAALRGLVAPMDLSAAEQDLYFDRFDMLLSVQSPVADTFFNERREKGLGVGIDDAGNIYYLSAS